MKNRKSTFILSVLFVSIALVFICALIVVPTIKFDKKTSGTGNTYVNKNYETNKGDSNIPNASDKENQKTQTNSENIEFFINEQSVSKTKNIIGETTMFEISFKVFAVNETSSSRTIRASAFSGSYDISKYATFYKLECNETETSKTIPAGESEDFEISLKYVIIDTENFKDNQKYNLTVNYVSEEIISSFV